MRTWQGWHHHLALSLLAVWFLIGETHRGRQLTPALTLPQVRYGLSHLAVDDHKYCTSIDLTGTLHGAKLVQEAVDLTYTGPRPEAKFKDGHSPERLVATAIADVQEVLRTPDEVRQSRSDTTVLLFYRLEQPGRWLCAVTKRLNGEGFLITTYPTDAIKEGERIWSK